MPIKEIVSFGMGVVMMIAVTGGPWNLRENLRKVQFQILHEMTRVDNWGSPSPWHHESQKPRSSAKANGKLH